MRRLTQSRRRIFFLLGALAVNGLLWQVALAGPVGPVPALAVILGVVDAIALLALVGELTGLSASGSPQAGQGLTLQDDAAYRQTERRRQARGR
jgi:hypothetical protein